MSRACCCSVSHTDGILLITTIQDGQDAMARAKEMDHVDIVSALEQVVCECEGVCVCEYVWWC